MTAEGQLNAWKAYAEKQRKHSSELESEARRQFEQQLEQIRAKQAEAREHFTKLKAAGEENWARWKIQLDKAWEEMNEPGSGEAPPFPSDRTDFGRPGPLFQGPTQRSRSARTQPAAGRAGSARQSAAVLKAPAQRGDRLLQRPHERELAARQAASDRRIRLRDVGYQYFHCPSRASAVPVTL
ncbi:MAG: hypothetical protein ACT4P3_01625 [Betaproteobacteria bacterium]